MEFISDKIQTIKKILSSRKGLSSIEVAGDTFEFEYVEAFKWSSEYDSRLDEVKIYLHGLLDDKIANWEVCKYDKGLNDNYWLYSKENNSYFCEVNIGAPRM